MYKFLAYNSKSKNILKNFTHKLEWLAEVMVKHYTCIQSSNDFFLLQRWNKAHVKSLLSNFYVSLHKQLFFLTSQSPLIWNNQHFRDSLKTLGVILHTVSPSSTSKYLPTSSGVTCTQYARNLSLSSLLRPPWSSPLYRLCNFRKCSSSS